MVITNLILLLLACLVLIVSAELLVKSLKKIAGFLRVSEFVVGFILMALATSLPELFVGISSALNKNSALSLGNVIGANILNLTLVMGIIILLGNGITIKNKRTKKDSLYMVALASLPLILMLIGNSLSRIDGMILIAAFLTYSILLYRKQRLKSKEFTMIEKRWEPVAYTVLFIFGLLALFFSSHFVVKYASSLSIELNFPPIFIGLFLISIGTTLPELIFGTRAVLGGNTEMALGDQIGSVIANATFILGVAAIIFPIKADLILFFTSGIFMIIVAFLFATFVESGNKLSLKEGISLIMLYVFFVIIEFYMGGL
jgi:cation:H+ antiporter